MITKTIFINPTVNPTSNRQATDTYKNEENEEKIIISDFSLTPDQPIIAKKTLRKKENGKHRFCDSPYFDPNEFRANIGWSQELADYWWDVLADASEANETMKYNNWLAVARQWRRRKESS